MSGIIKFFECSYRISSGPEINKDNNIFVFNGISLDISGNKESVRMLFVRNSLGPEDLKEYGTVTRICKLPEKFSDDRFHKKCHIDISMNSEFDLYIADKVASDSEKKNKKRILPIIIAIAVVAVLLLFLLLFKFLKFLGGRSDKNTQNDSVSSTITDQTSNNPKIGDLNGDGSINAIDASFVLSDYIKLSTGSELSEDEKNLGDVNCDSKIDATDASIILGYYSYLSTVKDEKVLFEEYCKNYIRSE